MYIYTHDMCTYIWCTYTYLYIYRYICSNNIGFQIWNVCHHKYEIIHKHTVHTHTHTRTFVYMQESAYFASIALVTSASQIHIYTKTHSTHTHRHTHINLYMYANTCIYVKHLYICEHMHIGHKYMIHPHVVITHKRSQNRYRGSYVDLGPDKKK